MILWICVEDIASENKKTKNDAGRVEECLIVFLFAHSLWFSFFKEGSNPIYPKCYRTAA